LTDVKVPDNDPGGYTAMRFASVAKCRVYDTRAADRPAARAATAQALTARGVHPNRAAKRQVKLRPVKFAGRKRVYTNEVDRSGSGH
jgi:hypothetical protein